MTEKLGLSPGKITENYCAKADLKSERRYKNACTKEFKLQRNKLKKAKVDLRNKFESSEGTSYESNIQLLRDDQLTPIAEINPELEPIIVLFDLETTGFGKNTDILQIAAKSMAENPLKKAHLLEKDIHHFEYILNQIK